MCQLCAGTEEDRRKARDRHMLVAQDLRRLADQYMALGQGTIKPHTTAVRYISLLARSAVRELVNDWI